MMHNSARDQLVACAEYGKVTAGDTIIFSHQNLFRCICSIVHGRITCTILHACIRGLKFAEDTADVTLCSDPGDCVFLNHPVYVDPP